MEKLSENLFVYRDACRVYVVKNGESAILIDFGSGDVLDRLADIGVSRVEAVLMTHHHRDQGQGLSRAARAGIPIWVPHSEQDLFAKVDSHWQAREVDNNYNVRQDRFSLLEPVPIAGTLKDYETRAFAGVGFTVVPTPGHTVGSITLFAQVDGYRLAFTGDLIAGPGKVWSLAATQWTYNGGEGIASSVLSLLDLAERESEVLLPSHGEPIDRPAEAITLLVERLQAMLKLRRHNARLLEFREHPFEEVTPHLLKSRASFANYYVLLSAGGKALFFDFGYDFITGNPAGADRSSRRPWLYTLGTLKKQYGVDRVDTVVPTHYHDDHVAGIPLLRDREGTRVWVAETFSDVLRHPTKYDLPCLWYDPIPVDRELPLGEPIRWEEYEFTLHPLQGHTLYAVGIEIEVDGKRVLVAGDQYQGNEGVLENYVYANRFRIQDYVESAALYAKLKPDVILTGHWPPLWVQPGYFEELAVRGAEVERLHRELLPLEEADFGVEGFGVRITPYQAEVQAGQPFTLYAEAMNPFPREAKAELRLAVPHGWRAEPEVAEVTIAAGAAGIAEFRVTPGAAGLTLVRRARVGADLTVAGRRFGQQGEALITVR